MFDIKALIEMHNITQGEIEPIGPRVIMTTKDGRKYSVTSRIQQLLQEEVKKASLATSTVSLEARLLDQLVDALY